MTNLKKWLLLWDGVWSIPLSLLLFIGFGYAGEWLFGEGFGAMSPAFFHSALFAALAIVFVNFIAWLGMWFNFRAVFNYYRKQSTYDFQTLTPLKKICVLLLVYLSFFWAGIVLVAYLV